MNWASAIARKKSGLRPFPSLEWTHEHVGELRRLTSRPSSPFCRPLLDPQRITEDLNGSFTGELRFDPLTRAMYASDASLYEITPLGVAYPRHRDDVVALSKYCLLYTSDAADE